MARAEVTVQTIDADGHEPTYSSWDADDIKVSVSGKTFVHVKNGAGTARTVTAQTPGTVKGQAIAEVTVAIPAGEERMIWLDPDLYQRGPGTDQGLAYLDVDDETSVTVAALRVP